MKFTILALIVAFTSTLNAAEKSAEIACENSEINLHLNLKKGSNNVKGFQHYNFNDGEFTSYAELYCTVKPLNKKTVSLECENEFGEIWSSYVIPKNIFSLKKNRKIKVIEQKRGHDGEIYKEVEIVGCKLI